MLAPYESALAFLVVVQRSDWDVAIGPDGVVQKVIIAVNADLTAVERVPCVGRRLTLRLSIDPFDTLPEVP